MKKKYIGLFGKFFQIEFDFIDDSFVLINDQKRYYEEKNDIIKITINEYTFFYLEKINSEQYMFEEITNGYSVIKSILY